MFRPIFKAISFATIFLITSFSTGYIVHHFEHKQCDVPMAQSSCPLPKQAQNKNFHSQYLEDYILSQVFSDVIKGSYIDVGANNPNKDSVTKHFYEIGWRGINVEPISKWYEELQIKRPDDVNINMGISNKTGSMTFYHVFNKDYVNNDGLSTFNKSTLDDVINDKIHYETQTINVTTLSSILEQHPLLEINFIKIDVEGKEREVLEGIDFTKHRAHVFILEATEPMTINPSHQKWEDVLLKNDYKYIMFDGINRYYVAKEYSEKLHNKFYEGYVCAANANEKYKIINNCLGFFD